MNKINESGEVTFGQAWKDFWTGYFDFKGASTRAGFWWGMLDYFIINFVWNIINSIVKSYNMHVLYSIGLDKTMIFITGIIHLVLFIPMLSVLVRRLRDTGLKESIIITLIVFYVVLLLIALIVPFITFIGIILIIVFAVLGCMPTGKFNGNSNKEG